MFSLLHRVIPVDFSVALSYFKGGLLDSDPVTGRPIKKIESNVMFMNQFEI